MRVPGVTWLCTGVVAALEEGAVVPFGHYAIGFPPGLKAPHPHAPRLLARL